MRQERDLSAILILVLYFVLGVVLVAATDKLLKTFNYIMVSICGIIGVVQMISYFINKKYRDSNNYSDLLMAVVFIWVSLVLYVYYGFIINILPILFSLYMLMVALSMFSKYINYKEIRNLVLSIIAMVIGLLLVFNPGSMILIYLKITGAYLILLSVLEVFAIISSKKKESI